LNGWNRHNTCCLELVVSWCGALNITLLSQTCAGMVSSNPLIHDGLESDSHNFVKKMRKIFITCTGIAPSPQISNIWCTWTELHATNITCISVACKIACLHGMLLVCGFFATGASNTNHMFLQQGLSKAIRHTEH
jgi:hypothetical protein